MLLAFAYRDGLAADPRRPNVGAGHGLAGWAGAAAVLLGVLALYSQPGFLVMLSDMIWACFG